MSIERLDTYFSKKSASEFSVDDAFNGNKLHGWICMAPTTKYGALYIDEVNGKPTEQFVLATPKMHYPHNQEGVFSWKKGIIGFDVYEKLDGCFSYETMVMTDAGRKRIGTLYNSGEWKKRSVLAFDETLGEVKYVPIISMSKQLRKKEFLTVKVNRAGNEQRSKPYSFHCTPNHKIYIGNGKYKSAEEIKVGDTVYVYVHPHLVESQVKDIGKFSLKMGATHKYQYDMQTETHNYFVNNVLVHNSNIFQYGYKDAEGNQFYTYKTRRTPVLQPKGVFSLYELWSEVLDIYPDIPEYPYKNDMNMSYEMYGRKNLILVRYPELIDTKGVDLWSCWSRKTHYGDY